MGLRHTGGMTGSQLRDRIGGIAGPTFRGALSASLGAEGLRLYYFGFRGQVDPYGRAWASVERGGTPLIKTGQMRQSGSMEVTQAGFRIGIAVPYAAYHQFGTKRRRFGLTKSARKKAGRGGIRRRTMIPTNELGGLGRWKPALDAVAAKVMKRWGTGA